VTGIQLDSYADLVKIANIPKVIQQGWDDIGFQFWALAFKVNPRVFVRISRDITLGQPRGKIVGELPKADLHPVTLPVKEAVESLKITLASFIKPARVLIPQIGEIKIKPISYLLVYIPFKVKHHDLVQEELHLSINRNQLALSGNL